MKTKITILSFALIALMMTFIGCKKETPIPSPAPSQISKTWTVQYTLSCLNVGVPYNITYIQNGITYTVNNAQQGWTISFNAKTGDYVSVSCSIPYINTPVKATACVYVYYNGQVLNSDCQFYPSTSASASGTLP